MHVKLLNKIVKPKKLSEMKVLAAPFGYSITKTTPMDDSKKVENLCLALSNDMDFQNRVKRINHKQRIEMLLYNGFSIINKIEKSK